MLSTDAGLVIGSRYIASGSLTENWGLYRRLLSRGGSLYVNAITHMRIADTTGGFKVWRADTLKSAAGVTTERLQDRQQLQSVLEGVRRNLDDKRRCRRPLHRDFCGRGYRS